MTDIHFEDENSAIYHGDCLDAMVAFPDGSVDLVLTDPPYGLSDHRPSDVRACMAAWMAGEEYQPRARGGFMGENWDAWVPGPEVWREALRVLRPGGHIMVFAGTRSMDLICMAIRLAEFEFRDSIGYANDGGGAPLMAWTHGTGFPKSLDVSKAIDKAVGADREVIGPNPRHRVLPMTKGEGREDGAFGANAAHMTSPTSEEAKRWKGWGTALKPAWEPIILARKPLEGTVAQNVMTHGCGGLNIDACRVGTGTGVVREVSYPDIRGGNFGQGEQDYSARKEIIRTVVDQGRWPSNLIHDGSDDVMAVFAQAGKSKSRHSNHTVSASDTVMYGPKKAGACVSSHDNEGTPARFSQSCAPGPDDAPPSARFHYAAKASQGERAGSRHPCVKPLSILRHLARLGCPPGGTILDPFAGSGSTMEAALLEGFRVVGVERDEEWMADIVARIARANGAKKAA